MNLITNGADVKVVVQFESEYLLKIVLMLPRFQGPIEQVIEMPCTDESTFQTCMHAHGGAGAGAHIFPNQHSFGKDRIEWTLKGGHVFNLRVWCYYQKPRMTDCLQVIILKDVEESKVRGRPVFDKASLKFDTWGNWKVTEI